MKTSIAVAVFMAASATGASAHYCHHPRVVMMQRPAYYAPPQRQWNPIGAIMAVPRAALEVPRAALAVPGRILGLDDD